MGRGMNVQESTTTSNRTAAVDWIARAKAVAPAIAHAADRIEREREIPDEVITALHDRQLFRMLLARSCGGGEAEPAVYVQAIEEIAQADASTAWCVNQASGGTVAAALSQARGRTDDFRRSPARSSRRAPRSGRRWRSRAAIG